MEIESKIFEELKKSLSSFGSKYFISEDFNRSKISDDLRNYNEALLEKLFQIDFIKQHFIKEVAGQKLFQIEQLEEAILYNNYWDTSYTKYENRIGLASKGKFLEDSQDVVLDFPFKDGVLTASMTKEDNEDGYDDAFLNEVIEKDEIDRLFDKKIFVNSKRYDKNGESVVTEFSEDTDNLIIKGNNLLALQAIKDKYAGKVKVIYIDPPYNTKGDSFIYNDKFNHSSWLAFIKNRLEISYELLSEDGVIFISLDDNEAHYCKVLADSIFGRENFVADISVKSRASVSNDKIISSSHNHLLFFAKKERVVFSNKADYGIEPELKGFNSVDEIGNYKLVPVDGPGGAKKGNPYYEIMGISGYWRFSKEKMEMMLQKGKVVQKGSSLYQKYYMSDAAKKRKTITTWWDEGFLTSSATSDLKKIFDGSSVFNNPKNENLIKRILEFSTKENDIVLDFFMGSATTQAVAMKMNRRFIGIEQMDYINDVSVPRLQKVIAGEQGGISKDVNWQGGGSFVYTELMPKNMGYLQDIIHSKTLDELKVVYNRMLEGTDSMEPADISFRADLDKIDWLEGFNENKRLLIKLLDKNGLYYNYSEIDDINVRELISDNDYLFNKQFYKGGE